MYTANANVYSETDKLLSSHEINQPTTQSLNKWSGPKVI